MKDIDRLFLETPTINRKKEALKYLQEHIEYNSNLNGTGSMDRCLMDLTYEEWLEEIEKKNDNDYLLLIKKSPSKTYFIIREKDNRLVGMIDIRYNITNERLKNGASHIGYGIRPTERKKGYAKIALYLGLLEEQKLGEEKVLLDCDINNIGSNKTIIALGGILEKTELDKSDNTMTNYYWIKVDDSIAKYAEQYSSKIKIVL